MSDRLRYLKSIFPVFGIFLTLTAFAISGNVIPPLITTIANEIAANYTSFGYIIMLQFLSLFIAGIVVGASIVCQAHDKDPGCLFQGPSECVRYMSTEQVVDIRDARRRVYAV